MSVQLTGQLINKYVQVSEGEWMKKELKKRLVYLFTGELSAIIVFIYLYFFYSVNPNNSYSLMYVFFILIFILLQGSFYWFIMWRNIKSIYKIFSFLFYFLNVFNK